MILRIDTRLEVDIPHPAKPYLEGCETMIAYPLSIASHDREEFFLPRASWQYIVSSFTVSLIKSNNRLHGHRQIDLTTEPKIQYHGEMINATRISSNLSRLYTTII
jgi:hypothetical protein